MIIKINGSEMAAPGLDQGIPGPGDLLWGIVEKGRDAATEKTAELSNDLAIWILDNLKEAGLALGKFLLQVGPDACITIAMIFCIGAIVGIPKAGKWTSILVVSGLILEIFRKAVLI